MVADNQNLRHTSPFQMVITLEIQWFVEAYLGDSWDCYFFGHLLTIVVQGHTSVEKPRRGSLFLQIGHIICTCVGIGGGGGTSERREKQGFT